MKLKIVLLLLYIGLSTVANATTVSSIESIRSGDMKKLVFLDPPQPVSEANFSLGDGLGNATLGDFRGKWILLNFWATWCAPCKKEMPMLSEIQIQYGGENFEVITLATGRNSAQGIANFFSKAGISNLPHYHDPKQNVAKEMSVFGLPTTMIIDPNGFEIARLRGDADWSSNSAKRIIEILIAQSGR
ncbi:MAG: TlpA disulfide reductase family protein [Aestuariivita sp.]|nr:TlpA disulfide reductase family protein [Aestuariivita sp.]